MKTPGRTLTHQELELMKIVWETGDCTVREVYEALLEHRRIAYTTVMTMLNVLERKGHLKKRADGRSYRYRAVQPRRKVVGSMVRDFVDRVFGGSAEPLLLQLLDDKQVTADELDQLVRRIRRKK